MATDAQRRADLNYKTSNTKQVGLRFYPNEQDILDHLNAQSNKQGYIKRLIREDMERGRPD